LTTPRLSPTGASPVSQTAAVAGVEGLAHTRQQAGQPSLAALLGKTVQVHVLAQLRDGSFTVAVGDGELRMNLPPGVAAGARLPMTLTALEPHPTFTADTGAGKVVLTALAGAAPAPGSLLANGALPAGADPAPRLSDGARMISALLRTAGEAGGTGSPAVVVGAAPVTSEAMPEPAELARQLHSTLSHSGLFYEAHVAEWAAGRRELDQLQREPQMQHKPGSPTEDPDTARFISVQLASHEQAQVSWQGQLVPGQALAWQIEREAPRGGQADAPGEAVWQSRLRLRFPLLGEVGATLVLRSGQLQLDLRPDTPEAARQLRERSSALTARMDAAGIALSGLQIGMGPDRG
jgi:hypothetical protein